MRVLVVAMPLKEAVSSQLAAKAAQKGLKKAGLASQAICLADGGEGTVEAFLSHSGFKKKTLATVDALGRPVRAGFAWNAQTRQMVLAVSEAAGLWQIEPGLRNPMKATTFGLGAMMLAAKQLGAREILVGLGGSATVDGGIGLGAALGFKFLDKKGNAISGSGPTPAELLAVHRIQPPAAQPLEGIRVLGLCDVRSPLTGDLGAARVFGPQKGATPKMVEQLEKGLVHLEDLWRQAGLLKKSPPGAGAAGGLGGGLMAFCGGRLKPGAATIAGALNLEQHIAEAHIVLGLEGALDRQTAMGKGLGLVATLSKKQGVPFVALAGLLGEGYQALHPQGLTAAFSLQEGPMSLADSISQTEELIQRRCVQLGRLLVALK